MNYYRLLENKTVDYFSAHGLGYAMHASLLNMVLVAICGSSIFFVGRISKSSCNKSKLLFKCV